MPRERRDQEAQKHSADGERYELRARTHYREKHWPQKIILLLDGKAPGVRYIPTAVADVAGEGRGHNEARPVRMEERGHEQHCCERRDDPADSTDIERRNGNAADFLALAHEQRRNDEAADDEEYLDAGLS